jgi:3-hydroxybutyrate dehydrogenase
MGILKGKVAVVTGSTSGIGLAYVRAFAGAGANIVLNGMGRRPMSKRSDLPSRAISG